jgi:hypothetical protein
VAAVAAQGVTQVPLAQQQVVMEVLTVQVVLTGHLLPALAAVVVVVGQVEHRYRVHGQTAPKAAVV